MNGTAKGGLPAKDLCGKRRFAETDFRAAAGCLLGCRPVGGSVGFGNIAGVATAVTTGGPGAVFWMWLTAFLGMLIKQVEVTLAVYYRRTDENGVPYGGPTYYMERGLGEERHWGKLWLPLAFVFGIGIFSTFFISASTFTTSEVVAQSLGIPQAIAALIIMLILYFMIWGGVKKLGQILTKLVPIMSLSYLILGIIVILMHLDNLLPTLSAIFGEAFPGSAALGGFAGASVSKVISTGMARSVYSNEAGWGSSPMIHASSQTRHPVEQGLWGSFEVFVDTFVNVAVILILSGQYFKLLKDYKARYMHIGQVDPNMASFYGDKPEMKAALEKEKAAQK